jgi:hypothetical protein
VLTIRKVLLVEPAFMATKTMASILENDVINTIQSRFGLVDHDDDFICVYLNAPGRIRQLPQLFHELIYRLRLPAATTSSFS